MDKRLFVDTWGWLCLRDKREAKHQDVVKIYQDYKRQGGKLITTDFVLDETITLFFKRLSSDLAQKSMRLLDEASTRHIIHVEWITQEYFEQAKHLRERFLDKPDISFTDLTSMVVMQDLDISYILTGDAHFGHVNLGFINIP
jgi:predicted nucleic acid-binding protein